eukprot:14963102-Alexandrium_andersonii.AAC.1
MRCDLNPPNRAPPWNASESANPLAAFEAETVRAQERPRNRSPKLPRGAFCAVFRADSETDDEG